MKKTFCTLFLFLAAELPLYASDTSTPHEVMVSIAAEDKSHNAVPDLKLDEISLKVNGAMVAATSVVYTGTEPKDWVLLIDSSRSMADTPLWQPAIQAAIKNLGAAMRKRGDRVAVVSVGNRPFVEQDFTSDERLVNTAVTRLQPKGGTALHDALVASAGYLSRKRVQGRQQVIWVVTDGEDTQSNTTVEEAGDRIASTGIPILLSFLGDNPLGIERMKYLAKNSGGTVFRPANKKACDEEASKLMAFTSKEYLVVFSLKPDVKGDTIKMTTSRQGVSLLDHDRHLAQ